MSASPEDDEEVRNPGITGDWADLSGLPEAASAWAHNGIVITADRELIGFHAGQLVALDQNGKILRTVRPGIAEGHGITLVREGDEEYLWISDPGFVFAHDQDAGDQDWAPLFGRGVHVDSHPPRVVKMTLDGEIRSELPVPPVAPDSPPGIMGQYCPCGVAVDEERFGGSGDVWVADGYGSSLVHCFDKSGVHRLTLTGEEGGGRFICPHAVLIVRRDNRVPELYIADRENRRVQVYDLGGQYLRSFGETFLNSPSGLVMWGAVLVVAELYGRLTTLDADDNLIGYIGADPDATEGQGWPERPGWPNALTHNGHLMAPDLPIPEQFNSPHSVAVDANDNLYVSEWLIGGRYTKLTVRP
jgi:hypothetical protein